MNSQDNTTVLVAMSGGVDSSVAAALLKQQGYNLIGITMNLFCSQNASQTSCCSAKSAEDAKKVANQLGFPHYTLNLKDEFKKYVIDNFIEEYKNGRTPNPCVRCNQFIKFDILLDKAKELGAEFVATGHYARTTVVSRKFRVASQDISDSELVTRDLRLLKGIDNKKDQSYFLYRLDQNMLKHTMFPLGDMRKEEIRKIAKELKLPVAEKKESQEICFIENDDYKKFISENVPEALRPGPILDTKGKVIGKHDGIVFYTIGQKKGIGAHLKRMYVVEIDTKRNAIIIGEDKDTLKQSLTANDVTFVSGVFPDKPIDIKAKIRYNSVESDAQLIPLENKSVQVIFKNPQRAITPGQSVVFYCGDEVLGGGIIIKGGD